MTVNTQDVHVQVPFPVGTVRAVWTRVGFGPCMDHEVLLQVLSTVAPREHFAAHIAGEWGDSPRLQHNNMHLSLRILPILGCASKTTANLKQLL